LSISRRPRSHCGPWRIRRRDEQRSLHADSPDAAVGIDSLRHRVTLLVLYNDAIQPAAIPGFLITTLVGYLAWPAIGARFAVRSGRQETPRGIVIAILFSTALVVGDLLLRGEPVVAATVAPRLTTQLSAIFALVGLVTALHADRWSSSRPSRYGPRAEPSAGQIMAAGGNR